MEQWAGFFTTLTQVAMTIFAVTLGIFSINNPKWINRPTLRFTSIIGFVEFWFAAIFGFVMLMPAAEHAWPVTSLAIGVAGYGLIITHIVIHFRQEARQGGVSQFEARIMKLASLALISYTTFIISGVYGLYTDNSSGVYGSAAACIFVLISGSFEASWHIRSETPIAEPVTNSDGDQVH